MERTNAQIDDLTRRVAARMLARAKESRGLRVDDVAPRLRATLEKYLLRNDPSATDDEIEEFYDNLRADELLCVIACERGDEAAWRELIETQTATVKAAARAACGGRDAEAEDLAQSVWAELYGLREAEAGAARGKLAYYSGCGSLGGWLRAVVAQMSTDRHRRSARLVQTEDAAEFDALANDKNSGAHEGFARALAADPEQRFAERETAEAVREALACAVAALAPEDKLLIKLYYFDEMRLREAGALLGVHEATASRRLARLHSEIRKGVEAFLRKEKSWSKTEIARAVSDAADALSHENFAGSLSVDDANQAVKKDAAAGVATGKPRAPD